MRWWVGALLVVGAVAQAREPVGSPTPPRTTGPMPIARTRGIPLNTGRFGLVSFATPEHGFLVGASGHVFETANGGGLWTERARGDFPGLESPLAVVAAMDWLTPDVGLAAGAFMSGLLATTDGGRTWVPALEPGFRLEAIDHVGGTAWICGERGFVARSDDAGRTWHRLARPFASDEHCTTLTFVSPTDGWAGGANGSLSRTRDGGESWMSLAAPFTERRPRVETLPDGTVVMRKEADLKAFRVDENLGWVFAAEGSAFRTDDGGTTWASAAATSADTPLAVRIAKRSDGPRAFVATVGPSGDRPFLSRHVAARDAENALEFEGFELREWRGGELLRRTIPRRPDGPEETLQAVGSTGPNRLFGWSGAHLWTSSDAGSTWRFDADVGEPILRAAPAAEGRMLVLAASGRFLQRGKGQRWEASETAALDAIDLANAYGETPPASPFACLATTSKASIEVRYDVNGCFGGSGQTLQLSWDGDRGLVEWADEGWGHGNRVSNSSRRTTAAEAREAAITLTAAALTPEADSSFAWTTEVAVRLAWACGDAPSQVLRFSSHACDPGQLDDFAPANRRRGAHRACLLYDEATALANERR